MDRIRKALSPFGKAKLESFSPETPVYVLRAHISQTLLSCSELLQVSGVKADAAPRLLAPERTVAWKKIDDFVRPAEWFGYPCAPGVTYREVLVAYLRENLPDILRIPFRGVVVVLLSFPPHSIYDGSRATWQAMLDSAFGDYPWLIPQVVNFTELRPERRGMPYLYIDRDWTTLISGEKKTTIAFGTHTDYENFRCNDPSGSGAFRWSAKSFPSRKAAWAAMLSQLRLPEKVICFGDRKRGVVLEKALQEAGLPVELIWESPVELAVTAKLQEPRTDSKEASTPFTRWRRAEEATTADIFNI